MATFRFGRDVNMKWQGNDIQGPAGTIFRISDAYYEEFNDQVGSVEPTLEWLVTNELGAVQANVAGLPVSATLPITATTTTSGTNIAISAGTSPSGYILTSNGSGIAAFAAATGGGAAGVSSITGTAPIAASASTGAVTLSLNANYATSTHDHAGTYQVAGNYSTSTHLHESDYVNVTGDTMSGQLSVSSATTTTTVGFGEIVVAKGTSYGSITVNATDDHLHLRSKNPIEVLGQSGPTMQGIRARGLGVNSSHTYPTLIDDGITFGEDANLYRVSANALKTDDALEVVGSLTNGGTSVSLSTHTHSDAVLKSTVTTKGDLIVASGSAAVDRLALGTNGHVLTADSTTGNGIKWAAAPGGGGGNVVYYQTTAPNGGTYAVGDLWVDSDSVLGGPITLTDSPNSTSITTAATPNAVLQSMKNYQNSTYSSTTRVGNFPPINLSSTATTVTSGTIFHTRHIPERNITVSNLSFVSSSTVGASLTLVRFGIYTRSGSTFTLVARTASDTTIFTAASTRYTRALDTTGGYPATYDFVAGNEYWVSVIVTGTTMPTTPIGAATQAATVSLFGALLYTDAGETDLVISSSAVTSSTRLYSEVS